MKKIRFIVFFCFVLGSQTVLWSQTNAKKTFNPLIYGVPSLTITPDARGGGMGDIGAATEPDIYSQYWNPAKYAFAYSKAGLGLSYTPWLRSLVSDIDLAYLAGYYKIGDSDRQAIGASLRYFSLGEITLTGPDREIMGTAKPYEMALDVSYSLKLSETFSAGVAFRYIRSDLQAVNTDGDLTPGNSLAADIAGYYSNYVMAGNSECLLGLGFNISNIGQKISYDGGTNTVFIPTNLRLGASFLMPLDDYNTLSFNMDINKLLIPTRPSFIDDGDDADLNAEQEAALEKYRETGAIEGIFKSFSDAPGGAKEEFQEIMWSFGAEYAYDNQFFVRGGYFYEHPDKGNRQYFTLGAGFKLNVFQLDVAYLISTVTNNPLDQTLRFSLSFDMDGLRGLMR